VAEMLKSIPPAVTKIRYFGHNYVKLSKNLYSGASEAAILYWEKPMTHS
jgi:hypothetical protein